MYNELRLLIILIVYFNSKRLANNTNRRRLTFKLTNLVIIPLLDDAYEQLEIFEKQNILPNEYLMNERSKGIKLFSPISH